MNTIKQLNIRRSIAATKPSKPFTLSSALALALAVVLVSPWLASDAEAVVFCLKPNKPNKVIVRGLQCKGNETPQPLVSEGRSFNSGADVLAFVPNTDQNVASLQLPAGNWVLTAKVVANNNDPATQQFGCSLQLGGVEIDNLFDNDNLDIGPSDDDRNVVTLTGSGTLATDGTVDVICRTNSPSGNWLARSISAIQVQNLN